MIFIRSRTFNRKFEKNIFKKMVFVHRLLSKIKYFYKNTCVQNSITETG